MKKRRSYDSQGCSVRSGNPYNPFGGYQGYRNHLLISAYELNEMVQDIPIANIPDYWLRIPLFRQRFKRVAYMAWYIHAEDDIQCMIGRWCSVDIRQYAARFRYVGFYEKCSPCRLRDYIANDSKF